MFDESRDHLGCDRRSGAGRLQYRRGNGAAGNNMAVAADTADESANQAMPGAVKNLDTYIKTCNARRAANPVSNEYNARSAWWPAGRTREGPLFTMLLPPNSKDTDCMHSHTNGMLTARSRHPGGVNGLLADGSVRYFKDSVRREIWWALGSKAGGEVLSSGDF